MADSLARLAWRTVQAVVVGDDAAATTTALEFGRALDARAEAEAQREQARRAEEALREHCRVYGSWFPSDTGGLPPPSRRRRGWGWWR